MITIENWIRKIFELYLLGFEKIMRLLVRLFGKTFVGIDYAVGKDKCIQTTIKLFRGKIYITKIEELK